MSRRETPLQIADRELAQAEANHDELRRLYQIAQVEADRATETQTQLEAQYNLIMKKQKRGIRNGSYNERSIIEIGDAIEKAQEVINAAPLAYEAMKRAATNHNYKLAEQRKQYDVAVGAPKRNAWAEGVDPRGRPLPLLTDAKYKAAAAAKAAAKGPSFFGRLGSFFGRKPATEAESAARVAERAARQIANAYEADRSSIAGPPSYYRALAGPLIRPSAAASPAARAAERAAARAARYAEEPFAGPYSGADSYRGGKTKRRHTKRRKSRRSRK